MANGSNSASNHRHTNPLSERTQRRDHSTIAHDPTVSGLQGPEGVEGITQWFAQRYVRRTSLLSVHRRFLEGARR
jgi:hypothetical protein